MGPNISYYYDVIIDLKYYCV